MMGIGKVVFRGGSATNQALTPRPGRDTVAPSGQQPGLSVEDAMPAAGKAQGIAVDLLKPPLMYFPDDFAKGGTQGHGVIAPTDGSGNVDQTALEEWASCRETQQDAAHPLTQIVIDAIVERDVRSRT
jgi:hypothetical protein